jgi:YVTN family beta-propeller protein
MAAVRGIGASNPEAAPLAVRAEALVTSFTDELAKLPVDAPVNVASIPAGAELTGVLDELKGFAPADLPVTVNFEVNPERSEGIRNPMGLIAPAGAAGFPYEDPNGAFFGTRTIELTEPGLYAFADMVAPYMLGAVVVDDPLTIGLDFGEKLQVAGRNVTVPSNADIIQRLVNAFFTITVPENWQVYSETEDVDWNPTLPPAPILQYDEQGDPFLIPNLDAYYDDYFGFPKKLSQLKKPMTPGVGEVWVDTQMEDYAGKEKHGAATKINVEDWTIDRKIAAPEINMNNPHNMWTDKDYKYLYQTQWFDNDLSVFDRETGEHIRTVEVGPNPAHVMTRPGNDKLVVGINAGVDVVELAPGATEITKRVKIGPEGVVTHPHAHWTSHDGKTVITPNTMTSEATFVDMSSGKTRDDPSTEAMPIASSMTPDSKAAYVSNFLGMSISCISLDEDACATDKGLAHSQVIDLWKNYDPQKGPGTAPWGGLTIQLPVSPDGKALLAANTLSQTVTVLDPKTNKVVKQLPCNAGCHGINFGAKKGGGYYGYVSNKFSNAMQVIDVDPNGDGNIADAKIAGQLALNPTADTKMDDQLVEHSGIGGQGVVAIPLVYNGWSQENPKAWREKLTCKQVNPITPSAC